MSEFSEEMMELEEDTQKDKFLIFLLGDGSYGIDIKYVIEIIGMEPITEVPQMPNFIRGVINLRGRIIPVMDVRLKFKKEEKDYDDRTCIIVVDINSISIGLIIDRVVEVLTIEETNISPAPTINGNGDNANKYIKGIGKVGNDVKLLIDCDKLLEEDELEALNTKA